MMFASSTTRPLRSGTSTASSCAAATHSTPAVTIAVRTNRAIIISSAAALLDGTIGHGISRICLAVDASGGEKSVETAERLPDGGSRLPVPKQRRHLLDDRSPIRRRYAVSQSHIAKDFNPPLKEAD